VVARIGWVAVGGGAWRSGSGGFEEEVVVEGGIYVVEVVGYGGRFRCETARWTSIGIAVGVMDVVVGRRVAEASRLWDGPPPAPTRVETETGLNFCR
jgi:hypothetical protein